MTNEEGFQYYCETVPMKIDIGNLHVIDYYLRKATYKQLMDRIETVWPYSRAERYDFDIETEQREGWAFDD